MFGKKDFPRQGDLIWIDAEPHAGHEYGGHDVEAKNIRRPMLVISSDIYNERTGMIVGFPITSNIPAGFPAALKISGAKIHGYAIVSHLLGYDYEARNGQVTDHISKSVLTGALASVKDIFGFF